VGLSDSQIRQVLRNKWSGVNYSSRVWANRDATVSNLQNALLENLSMGKTSTQTFDALMEQCNYSRFATNRLLRTETSYVTNQVEAEAYQDAGVEKYELVAVLDGRTSPKCQELDGKTFPLDEKEVGVNFPPLHCFCRTVTAPVLAWATKEGLERLARDPVTGEVQKVPRDMNYKEWQEWQKNGASSGAVTGAKKTEGWQDRHADSYYEAVRKRAPGVDAQKIAQYTIFKQKAVEEIRQHVFVKSHQLKEGYKRFAPDYQQSQAWQRLTEGRGTETDLLFLKHEYVELTQMRIHGYTYDVAHVIANNRHNWFAEVVKRGE
jgi:SPP1 gp7 family putative phage head morphogenesis protein